MIRLKVGSEGKVFTVHEALLCHESKYFRTALQGSFRESQEKYLELDEEDPDIFSVFIYWLYGRDLPSQEETASKLPSLWALGDRRIVPWLQNEVINILHQLSLSQQDKPGIAPISISNLKPTWDMTQANSKLRSFMLIYVALITELDFYFETEQAASLPSGFAEQILCLISEFRRAEVCGKRRRREYWKTINLCAYHEHDEEFPPCLKTKENEKKSDSGPPKRKSWYSLDEEQSYKKRVLI